MRLHAVNENSVHEKGMETAPALLILGVVFVVAGFISVALVTMGRFPDPSSIVEYFAFGMFAAGIACIWASWHKLS